MFEAIVTFVSTEPDDISREEMDTRIAAGESIEHVISKIYRVEFETQERFNEWMQLATHAADVHVEQLTSNIVGNTSCGHTPKFSDGTCGEMICSNYASRKRS